MIELKLDPGEVMAAIDVCDCYSRVWVGHVSYLGSEICMMGNVPFDERRERQAEDLFVAMRALFLPECAGHGSGMNLGIWSERTNELAVCAYDMQQVIRHDWSWFENPEGDITRWFDDPRLRGSMPVPICQCSYDEDGVSGMLIQMEAEPARLFLDAILARQALLDLRLVDMMGLYTTDERVLAIARLIEGLYLEGSLGEGADPSDGDRRLTDLRGRIAGALGIRVGSGYRSLALERAEGNEPLSFGERCPKACLRR